MPEGLSKLCLDFHLKRLALKLHRALLRPLLQRGDLLLQSLYHLLLVRELQTFCLYCLLPCLLRYSLPLRV